MSALQIRPARAADATAACAVLRRSIAELCEADHRNDPQFLAAWLANKTPENVAAWIAADGNFVYIAFADGRIVGVAAMTRTGLITLNYVSPDARFKGVSKALLAELERKAAELGLAQCSLASTKTAQRFYRSAGFREQQGSETGGGIPMVKDLA
jgi:N-acetylglutamate synthase-like GNAT family acetyltransferase